VCKQVREEAPIFYVIALAVPSSYFVLDPICLIFVFFFGCVFWGGFCFVWFCGCLWVFFFFFVGGGWGVVTFFFLKLRWRQRYVRAPPFEFVCLSFFLPSLCCRFSVYGISRNPLGISLFFERENPYWDLRESSPFFLASNLLKPAHGRTVPEFPCQKSLARPPPSSPDLLHLRGREPFLLTFQGKTRSPLRPFFTPVDFPFRNGSLTGCCLPGLSEKILFHTPLPIRRENPHTRRTQLSRSPNTEILFVDFSWSLAYLDAIPALFHTSHFLVVSRDFFFSLSGAVVKKRTLPALAVFLITLTSL